MRGRSLECAPLVNLSSAAHLPYFLSISEGERRDRRHELAVHLLMERIELHLYIIHLKDGKSLEGRGTRILNSRDAMEIMNEEEVRKEQRSQPPSPEE